VGHHSMGGASECNQLVSGTAWTVGIRVGTFVVRLLP